MPPRVSLADCSVHCVLNHGIVSLYADGRMWAELNFHLRSNSLVSNVFDKIVSRNTCNSRSAENTRKMPRYYSEMIMLMISLMMTLYYDLPSWEVTYPLPKVLLKMGFLVPFGGIRDRSLEGNVGETIANHLRKDASVNLVVCGQFCSMLARRSKQRKPNWKLFDIITMKRNWSLLLHFFGNIANEWWWRLLLCFLCTPPKKLT